MSHRSTDQLLTLGMALTTDRRAMERRVRGVFARKRSAKGVLALSALLALALGFAAFTTACQPGLDAQKLTPIPTEQTTAGESELVSGGNTVAPADQAENAEAYTKQMAMDWLQFSLNEARKFPVPRMEDIVFTEHGNWAVQQELDDSRQGIAVNRFLEIANAIFVKSYTPDDVIATYYTDQSGFRADLWRIDTKDGVLCGALEADTLAFLSADCMNVPGDALHPSLADPADHAISYDYWGTLNPISQVERIAGILGGSAQNLKDFGGSGRDNATAGWMIRPQLLFQLDDGRYCAISIFADEALTPTTVCVYPDFDCAEEGVFWRADLESNPNVVQLLSPQDFRKGEPTKADMTRAEAIAFFDKLVDVAGCQTVTPGEKPPEPATEFYVDFSGTRENYWYLEGSGIILELTSKTERVLSLSSNGSLGTLLALGDIPSEQMGGQEYEKATRDVFAALYGKDAVESVTVSSVTDLTRCTMELNLTNESAYEIEFHKGMMVKATRLLKIDPDTWASVPQWLEKWASVDEATGQISIAGIENETRRVVPNWLADWVYVNNETGEIFAMEW